MSVYVDTLMNHGWRLGPNCHLFTDPGLEDELHELARKIGMRRQWFQDRADLPHYDLTASRRRLAVKYGAVEVDRGALVYRMRAYRAVRVREPGLKT